MAHAVFQFVFEGAVALVDIEVIAFVGIVGDIDIRPAVAVDIGDEGAEAEADEAAMDACLLGYFVKMAVIVAIQMIAASLEHMSYGPCRVGQVAAVGVVEGIDGDGAVVDHKAIQVAVAVVVEKSDLGGIGGDVEAVFGGFFGKGTVVVIDIEFIPSVAVAHVARVADVDIEPAVAIDVDHGNAGAPHAILAEACFVGDIFEMEVSLIQVELTRAHIGGEEDIGQAVVIDVADGYAAAVIEIAEKEAVLESSVLYIVFEPDAGAILIQQGKQGEVLLPLTAGKEKRGSQEAGEHQRSERLLHSCKNTKVIIK